MKRTSYLPFILLILILFLLVNVPRNFTDSLRGQSISWIYPTYQWAGFFRSFLLTAPTLSGKSQTDESQYNAELLLENQNLRSQLDAVYEWLLFDNRIEQQADRIQTLTRKDETQGEIYWRDFFQRRSEELQNLIEMQTQALPAKVIYREPGSWSSSLWIDVGNEDNEALGRQIVSKNSPVLVGNSLIGVIEFVDRKKSRVRLITDSGLTPSVRALRGKTRDRELVELLDAVFARINAREDYDFSESLQSLHALREFLLISNEDLRLAKGELHGSSEPIWRIKNQTLKGIGFNYDYADEEGPARDLKTGIAHGKTYRKPEAILNKGDLLITTGMDGVFPPGLHVAFVTHVAPLKEGAYAYEMEAKPTCPHIDDLTSVFVIPSVSDF